jgi:mRNA interferase RelE/StbE
MFKLILSSHAQKFLKKSDKQIYQRIVRKVKELSKDPFPSDSKRVIGLKDKVFRIRVGDYRIEYVVYYEVNEVLVSDIDKRERIYHR